MREKSAEWLPHLSGEIVSEAHGNYLDAYVVALEGWRRGLTLKWHVKESGKFPEMKTWFVDKPGQLFSLESDDKTHYFFRSRGDKVTNEAVEIGSDKESTKELLQHKGIKMPEGSIFTKETSDEAILRHASGMSFPIVLKPTDGSFGKGVITNIKNNDELKEALEYVRGKLNYSNVLLEEYIPGKEYRIYVVGDKVVGAMNRIPANVTGDGEHTVRSLIQRKNGDRALNPRLRSCPIIIDEEVERYLSTQDLFLDSVLDTGEQVFLTEKTNISIGGDPVDAFDDLSDGIKDSAVRALQAVPGLSHGAVDLIVHEETSEPYIIELNPTANLGGLLYPIEGQARDIPKEIIDYYFPETQDALRKTSIVYFDYREVLTPLQDKTAYNTKVVQFDYDEIHTRKFIIHGDVKSFVFHKWIKSKAKASGLHGFASLKPDESLEIVVAGVDQELVHQFRDILLENDGGFNINEVKEENYNETIKIGFEIEGEYKELLNNYKTVQRNLESSKKELKKLEKQYSNMLNSRAWKLTRPVRTVSGTIKKMYQRITKNSH
ncbi:acylphosphatase [Lacicoccus alkaliphilus]|uniref:Acylphosphatase n=1 Tax=Lacicoccus alkaliphilus DSM 16010 TaxID=1123231 RepID=A0A1M7H6Q4_9BACL|nr:acylphosphatase [Salinicoccus alkaliphilus]SHM24195.1 D-alanine-D-alanine ligase [Salinicoccus alkaliphilus DSM 16010]